MTGQELRSSYLEDVMLRSTWQRNGFWALFMIADHTGGKLQLILSSWGSFAKDLLNSICDRKMFHYAQHDKLGVLHNKGHVMLRFFCVGPAKFDLLQEDFSLRSTWQTVGKDSRVICRSHLILQISSEEGRIWPMSCKPFLPILREICAKIDLYQHRGMVQRQHTGLWLR